LGRQKSGAQPSPPDKAEGRKEYLGTNRRRKKEGASECTPPLVTSYPTTSKTVERGASPAIRHLYALHKELWL